MLRTMGRTEMNDRLWYPQLDLYDCIRRVGILVSSYGEPPGIERLCIADFYFANPPLLHASTMSRETRRRFNALAISRPQLSFLTYPAPQLLFVKMEPIQKEALRAMGGKGLLSLDGLQKRVVAFSQVGLQTFAATKSTLIGNREEELVSFLTKHFAATSEVGSQSLRNSTGLRRPLSL